ncbi:DNA-binding transcriptional regulator, MurR/RpiR family, contains HTH and SIS domains [Halobacillus karajensis]|uniref:HTH-type transcriptional regulator YbbH n=1 Tax=Halobacillus karajensis TaxID=195088 RepID=A0A024P2Q5_9BACI|nr:MurR/RpiR family transcriptional regulator [Halobacillus karajensis]CDQ19153.1 putative HTH-type transcriptional regulator YbbH [Halobacillus karajensis]CDQ22773.1 putative HTH-type transcriptional regulator YbbH [Halobacillus karajensis]CDQ26255.1 putative HTH-type transcriptional regulator YbbH [Halobacillus karajensis]SEH40804.1 DNA-binding transcriptional regulator, MurR/RpiR family, contains HTH and SIS domains [Halobacillus karajensis]
MKNSLTGGLVILNEMKDKLPPSEKKIAEFIIAQPHEAIHCTATQLGRLSSTSSAAVIRLCKSLGLKGLQELKLRISGDLQKKPEARYRDIQPGEASDSIVEKVTNNSLQAIRETTEMVDYRTLAEAVNVLKEAENIHFFGVGASGIIAQDAQQKFLRINKPTSAFTDMHNAAMNIANVSEKDVVFGISFSGETYETAEIMEIAKKKGARTISLTRYGQSPVTAHADVSLFISASREIPAPFRSGATSSRLAQLHMIDILFVNIVTEQWDEASNYFHEITDVMDLLKGKKTKNGKG